MGAKSKEISLDRRNHITGLHKNETAIEKLEKMLNYHSQLPVIQSETMKNWMY